MKSLYDLGILKETKDVEIVDSLEDGYLRVQNHEQVIIELSEINIIVTYDISYVNKDGFERKIRVNKKIIVTNKDYTKIIHEKDMTDFRGKYLDRVIEQINFEDLLNKNTQKVLKICEENMNKPFMSKNIINNFIKKFNNSFTSITSKEFNENFLFLLMDYGVLELINKEYLKKGGIAIYKVRENFLD